MKKIKRYTGIIGYGSLVILGVVAVSFLFPSVTASSQAESCLDNPTISGCYTAMAETEIGITANTAISLAIDSSVGMEVTPKSNGAVSSASTQLAVSTNSSDGYALYVQAGSESGDLVSTSSNVASIIKNTAKTNVALGDLERNSYGYALTENMADATTKYSTVPTAGSIVKKTTSVTPAEGNYAFGDTYYLSFGVNIGTDIQAGSYTGSVMVSAVANPKTLATMFDLDYMQDMTGDICTNTREGYTKQLIDTRDGKSYWVAKLKDGNCWMTQNLALDIALDDEGNAAALAGNGTKVTLDASNTDIIAPWVSGSEYPPTATNELELTGASIVGAGYVTASWDFGASIQATPLAGMNLTSTSDLPGVLSNDTIGEIYGFLGFVDIDSSWKPIFVAQNGNWVLPDGSAYSGLVTADKNAKTYDAHYLVGNYYQYNAATAGTMAGIPSGDAPGSICPKGWRMPNGVTDSSISKTYNNLFKELGLSGNFSKIEIDKLAVEPIYFSLSGSIYRYSGAIRGLGTNFNLLTRTAVAKDSSMSAYYFNYAGKTVWFTRNEGVLDGMSIRCVTK